MRSSAATDGAALVVAGWELRDRLRRVLALDPAAGAIEFDGAWLPWGYVGGVLGSLQRAFDEAGVPPDLAVALAPRNRPAHAAAMVSLVIAGRCCCVLNPFVSPEKFAGDAAQLDAGVLLADEEDWEVAGLQAWAARRGALGIALTRDPQAPVRVVCRFDAARAAGARKAAGDVVVEMLTSGTTGEPKRVPLKLLTLNTAMRDGVRSADASAALQLKRSPALLFAPLVHAGGLFALMLSMYEARPIALLEKFTVQAWTAAVRRHRPRFASLVPTLVRMILDADVPREDLSSLIAVRCGTAPLDRETHRAFEERYGIPVLINYGATEFAGAVSGWTLPEYRQFGRAKFGSVGRPRADIRLRILDPETGREAPRGAVGVLEIAAGRLHAEGAWTRTTDLASLDADGFLFIHGRADDAIIRGGLKVLPEQVAEVLRRHPAVADAVVVACPDPRLGQVPVAAVECRPGAARPREGELEALAREHLAPYQVPTRILVVDALPRTASMKISLPAVRAWFEPSATA